MPENEGAAPSEEADESLPSGPMARAKDQAKSGEDAIAAIRKRTDLTGKAIAGVGAGAISALGIAKLTDLFPLEGPDWLIALIIGGLLVAGASVVVVFMRYDTAQRPFVTVSRIGRLAFRNGKEKKLVRKIYDDAGRLNSVKNLAAYEAKAIALLRQAETEPDLKKKAELSSEADLIMAEVHAFQVRGAHAVVRERARWATSGAVSLACYALFFLGLATASISYDALTNEREKTTNERNEALADLDLTTKQVEHQKLCAETAAAGVVDPSPDCPTIELPKTPAKNEGGKP